MSEIRPRFDLALSLAFISAFLLIYFDIEVTILWRIALLLLALLLLVLRFTHLRGRSERLDRWFQLGLVFMVSFLVEVTVVTTGGFGSPLFILVHLFAIASSFLMSIQIALAFLAFTLFLLSVNVLLNVELYEQVSLDPWTPILYLVSFVVVIPLLHVAARAYTLKDRITELLLHEIHMKRASTEVILAGLNEIVIVTNSDWQILSVNEAFRASTHLRNDEVLFKKFLDVVKLEHESGEVVTADSLGLGNVMRDKSVRVVERMIYYPSEMSHPRHVTLQLRPIENLEGHVDQVSIIIGESRDLSRDGTRHVELQNVFSDHERALEAFRHGLVKAKEDDLRVQFEQLVKIEQDLLDAIELDDHEVGNDLKIISLDRLCRQVLKITQPAVQAVGIAIAYEGSERPRRDLSWPKSDVQINLSDEFAEFEPAFVLADGKWLKLLLIKLVQLGSLIEAGHEMRTLGMVLRLDAISSKDYYRIDLSVPFGVSLTKTEKEELFQVDYGSLKFKTRVRDGTGLEGYLVGRIAHQLRIDLQVHYYDRLSRLAFELGVRKEVPRHVF